MPIREITYTYNLGSKYSVAQIAKWVLAKTPFGLGRIGGSVSLPEAMTIARALVRGERWQPEYYMLHEPEADGPCQFEIVDVKTEDELRWEKQHAIHAAHAELLKRGAAGDAEAAIAYCKAAQENENFFLRTAYAGSAA